MERIAESSEIRFTGGYPPVTEAPIQSQSELPLNLAAALWRYRWAVVLPAVLGAVIAFFVSLQMPDIFRSTTRLIVESDRSPALDAVTGELVGGAPGIEIVQAQLLSDQVIETVYNDPRVVPFHGRFPRGLAEFKAFVIGEKALELEPEFADTKTARSLVMLLHFESEDEELSEQAVKSFSDALQDFYDQKHKSSKSDLLDYMMTSRESLFPEMQSLDREYSDFRAAAPMEWHADGSAINPHRDRQIFLVSRRSTLFEQLRSKQSNYEAVKAIRADRDPEVALAVIEQFLDKRFQAGSRTPTAGFGQDDEQLGMVKIDRDLVPLMVELSQMTAEFGAEHPKVRNLSQQIQGLRAELRKIVREQTNRITELIDGNEQRRRDAAEAIAAIENGLSTEVQMLTAQIKDLDKQIADEKERATSLARYERDHEALLRRRAQQQLLMDQVSDQMSRVELTEEESRTRIIELTAPSRAYKVSPILLMNLGIGIFAGMFLGAAIAFLLEKNANTFRDPEEIADVVGAPVLTHLPYFKSRVRKERKGVVNAFADLDPNLAVVHSPASIAAEAIRSCRTSVFFETAGVEGGKVIQVTSPLPGDGKSTIAGNLACSIAQSGKSTIVVDCDLRRPQLSDNFAVTDKQGLTDILDGRCDYVDAVQQTPIATLKVIPSGPVPANPAEALTLPDMSDLLEMLREQYDYVIVDSPPLLLVTDPSILASYVDGVLIAVKVRRKSKPNTKEAAKILRAVGANILGVLVNNSDEPGKSDGYRGQGYYRYGRQASRYRRRYGISRTNEYSRKSGDEDARVISGRSQNTELANATSSEQTSSSQSS